MLTPITLEPWAEDLADLYKLEDEVSKEVSSIALAVSRGKVHELTQYTLKHENYLAALKWKRDRIRRDINQMEEMHNVPVTRWEDV